MKISPKNNFRALIPENLIKLASVCQHSLYIIGGSVRDMLCGFNPPPRIDWDICSPMDEESFLAAAKDCGFAVRSVYRHTGTVKLSDGKRNEYEFTRFRSDKYVRGVHTPAEITFTDDISKDARRRDFTVNAVYYDIKRDQLIDPLGGLDDLRHKTLRTVAPSEQVFGEDGLRLLRLARFSAQLGFTPSEDCLLGATGNAALIDDIAPERIFAELCLLLAANEKHGEPHAVYRGLKVLQQTGVLARILPELTAGEGMAQRAQFHDHDVLEHSLRCCDYAPAELRWAALLHDIGKPYCMTAYGNFYAHDKEGEALVRKVLHRFKAPARLTEETSFLTRAHMWDFDLKMKPAKVRWRIVQNYPLLPKLLALKQADYSACKDDLSPAPTVLKWQRILAKMQKEGVPFTLKQLAVSGRDVLQAGVCAPDVGTVLNELWRYCSEDGKRNDRAHLLKRIEKIAKEHQ